MTSTPVSKLSLSDLPDSILLDTDVIIGYLYQRDKHHAQAAPLLKFLTARVAHGSGRLFYNPIVEAEAWPGIKNLDGCEHLARLLSVMERVELNEARTRRGADLSRFLLDGLRDSYQKRTGPDHVDAKFLCLLKPDKITQELRPDWRLGDALIAACAEDVGAAVLTANYDFDFLRGTLETDVIHLQYIDFGQHYERSARIE